MIKGVVLAESLRTDVPLTLEGISVSVVRRDVGDGAVGAQPTIWTFLEIAGHDDAADALATALAEALEPAGGWYADFGVGDDHVVVFAGRVFRYRNGDAAARAEVAAYARGVGVPEHQLDWPEDEPAGEGAAGHEAPADELAGEVQAFWEMARGRAKLGGLDVVTGGSVASTIPPQAWSFGDDPTLADELLALVLDGTKRATASSVAELEAAGEPTPVVGELSILLDGAGHPRALIRTTDVEVAPFGAVSEELADEEFDADQPVVCERFEVLWPKDQDR